MVQDDLLPLVHEIPYQDTCELFRHFHDRKWAIFLDSAKKIDALGHYSFIAVDPFLTISSKDKLVTRNQQSCIGNPFDFIKTELLSFPLATHPNLPPFQGGVAGYFGYELCQHLEELPKAQVDDLGFSDMAVGFYDLVMAFDHEKGKAWIFSSGYPIRTTQERLRYAQYRIEWLLKEIQQANKSSKNTDDSDFSLEINANFTQSEYEKAVKKAIEYIYAGDIFEVNLAQRFIANLPENLSAFDLYEKLRLLNPAPFSAYINGPGEIIASASPERFLQLRAKHVETRPIKGTKRRGVSEIEDACLAEDLLNSEKDRAENIMIVDLMRNDLSRVCVDNTVKVDKLCELETYATVHHLVSVVSGELKPNFSSVDLLMATFPGGSITGAPKIRSMEIIAEIEPHRRGPYCGSVGYLGFNGDMDTSITIRTYAIKNNVITFHAGGAVVADSNPTAEYEETLSKARALREVLEGVYA